MRDSLSFPFCFLIALFGVYRGVMSLTDNLAAAFGFTLAACGFLGVFMVLFLSIRDSMNIRLSMIIENTKKN